MNHNGLLKALEYAGGTHTINDVLDQIEAGDAQFWTDGESVIVTEIHRYPRKLVLHFWLAAGELEKVVALSHQAMSWGKDMGCEMATLVGRRGWEKALATEGWKSTVITMGRVL